MQFIDRLVDVFVVAQRHLPAVQKVQKTVEVPQIQFIDKLVDALLVMQQTNSCSRTDRLPHDCCHH